MEIQKKHYKNCSALNNSSIHSLESSDIKLLV